MIRSIFGIAAATSIFAGTVCAAPLQATNSIQHPTIEDFFSVPLVSQARISPDGNLVAEVSPNIRTGSQNKQLSVINLVSNKVTPCFRAGKYETIEKFWWVNNKRLLVYVISNVSSGSGMLFAINIDGSDIVQFMGPGLVFHSKQVKYVTQANKYYFTKMLYSNVGNSGNFIVEAYRNRIGVNAYEFDAYAPSLKQVTDSLDYGFRLFVDDVGQVRFAYKRDWKTGKITYYYRKPGSSLDWGSARTMPGSSDPLFAETGPAGFSADGKALYWWGRTATTTLGLYKFDPETQKFTPVYSNPDFDVSLIYWPLDWTVRRPVIAALTMPGGPNLHVLDGSAPKARYMLMLLRAFPGQMVNIVNSSEDGSRMVVRVYSDRNPGAYYLFDASKKNVNLLFKQRPGIDPQKMAHMRPIEFKARDGLLLHGYLILPPDNAGKNLPLILNPHNGPESRNYWGWDSEAQYFAMHGYAVLQVNYRGSVGYGKKFLQMGYHHWWTAMQSDLADAVRWAVQQGYADPRRVCIYGNGYGGYAAMESSVLYPGLYRCAVGYNGVYDLAQLHGTDFGGWGYLNNRLLSYLDLVVGGDNSVLETHSPVNQAAKIKDSLFIVYGGADRIISPKNSEEFMSALDKAHAHYEKMYEPTEGPEFVKPKHKLELYTRMLAFFNKYIGPDAAKH